MFYVRLGQPLSELVPEWRGRIMFRLSPDHGPYQVPIPPDFEGREPVIAEIRTIPEGLAVRVDLRGSDYKRMLWFTLGGQQWQIISARVGSW